MARSVKAEIRDLKRRVSEVEGSDSCCDRSRAFTRTCSNSRQERSKGSTGSTEGLRGPTDGSTGSRTAFEPCARTCPASSVMRCVQRSARVAGSRARRRKCCIVVRGHSDPCQGGHESVEICGICGGHSTSGCPHPWQRLCSKQRGQAVRPEAFHPAGHRLAA